MLLVCSKDSCRCMLQERTQKRTSNRLKYFSNFLSIVEPLYFSFNLYFHESTYTLLLSHFQNDHKEIDIEYRQLSLPIQILLE